MRPRRRVIDWGLFLVFGACLLVAWPFAAQPGLPFHTDADLWVSRSVQITNVLHSGTLYTRWAPDFNAGLGSPIFNYLAPLPHYLSGLHQLITDADPTDSIKILMVLSMSAAGCGMFLFARQRWSPAVGLLSALFYLFSPPIAFVLPHQTGDLADLMSLGLLPWALWALDRCGARRTRFNFVIVVTVLSAWALADARLTLLGLPIILLALLSHWKSVGWVAVLALLIAAFFWLPAIVERDSVIWLPLIENASGNSIAPAEIFDWMTLPDSTVLNPPVHHGLGLALGLGAIAGFVSLIVSARRTRQWFTDRSTFAALGVVYLIAVIFSAPYPVLLAGSFCLSVLAGQTGLWIERISGTDRRALAVGMVCLPVVLLTLLPLYQARWISAPLPNANSPLFDGLDGLLLPATAYHPPESLSTLAVNAVRSTESSPNLGVLQIERMPLSSRYTVNLEKAVSVKFDRLSFPGWFINIDGAQNETASTAQGLVTYTLPQSAREVVIWFGSTQIRSLSWLITGLGILLLLWRLRLLRPVAAQEAPLSAVEHPQVIALTAVLVIGTLTGAGLWFGRPALLPTRIEQSSPFQVTFKDVPIELTAYHIDTKSGAAIEARLYWRALQPITVDYLLQVRLVRDADQQLVNEVTRWYVGGVPSSRWLPGYTVRDAISIAIPAPGTYHLEVRLGQCRPTLWCDKPQSIPGSLNGVFEETIRLPQSVSAAFP